MVMKSTLRHPRAFGVLNWNCCACDRHTMSCYSVCNLKWNYCGFEQHTVSCYKFCSFKVKLLCLWTAHSVMLQILYFWSEFVVVLKSSLCNPRSFVVLMWKYFVYEQQTVSSYSCFVFKLKLLWLWWSHGFFLQLL